MKQFLFFCLVSGCLQAQVSEVDTIPFNVDKKLLVFKGKVNGVVTDFAFDTGAGKGVATSKNITASGINIMKSKIKILDSNMDKKSIVKVKIKELEIGSHSFANVKDVSTDMLFLACNNLYLLGQNVIKKLNWKIDFEHFKLYVSKKPFPRENTAIVWPIDHYESNRPMLKYEIGTKKSFFLVDFGFTGIVDFNDDIESVNFAFDQHMAQNKTSSFLNTNMGLFGFSKATLSNEFRLDSMIISDTKIFDIPVSIAKNTDTKLGLGFFKNFCKTVILNFSENKIMVIPKGKAILKPKPYDIKLNWKDNKILVIGKNMSPSSTASYFEIGEEIQEINGKTAADYKDECEFFNWFFFDKAASITLKKQNGQAHIIYRDLKE